MMRRCARIAADRAWLQPAEQLAPLDLSLQLSPALALWLDEKPEPSAVWSTIEQNITWEVVPFRGQAVIRMY